MITMRLESNHKQRKLVTHSFVAVVMALSALQAVVPASNGKSVTASLSTKRPLEHPPQIGFVQPRCAHAPAAQKLRVLLALPMVSRNAPAAATGGT